MDNSEWWSQPMRPDGDNTGTGILNQLGRSQYGEYAVLVREAVQNSWDARIGSSSVSVNFSLRTLGKHATAWRDLLGHSKMPSPAGDSLDSIDSNSPILIISDRGTVGLGGPLRSDEPVQDGEKANFVQFLRNVGEPRDTTLGGGTYGYGKATFFRVSSASAILVDSKNSDKSGRGRRLMAAALTDPFTGRDGKRFTGRHWWGQVNDGIPDPLLGEVAEEVAGTLGLPGFEEFDTGTDIVILLPKLLLESENQDLNTLAERLRAHIYWHLWPKFSTAQRSRGIQFSVDVQGNALKMPHPTELPIIGDFTKALDEIAARRGISYRMKKYGANDLGEIAFQYVLPTKRTSADLVAEQILSYCPFDLTKPLSHIATMRQAELVVDYISGAPMPSQEVGYVGVFRASAMADDAFANSEPPTHDSWVTNVLTGSQLGIVRGAKTFIQKQCELFAMAKGQARSKVIEGLGRLSNELGALLPSGSGTRADSSGKMSRTPENGKAVKSRSVWRVGPTRVVVQEGVPVVEASLEILLPPPKSLVLIAECQILLANRKKENPAKAPLGARAPRFIGWFAADNLKLIEELPALSEPTKMVRNMVVRFEFLEGTASRVVVSEDV